MSTVHEISNEQLVARIKAGEDTAGNMAQLYEQVKGFIHSAAWKYRAYAELEDLEQEGYLALYPAIDGFDPAAGCLFLTYAGSWIRQAITRYIQNNGGIRIPIHELERIQQYRKLERKFLSQLGRKPSDQETGRCLGLTRQQVKTLKESMKIERLSSLDACYTEDGETTLGDAIPGNEDVEREVLDKIEHCQLREALWAEVDSLPDNQPRVLRSLFQEGQTLKQTGEEIGVTLERVRVIEQNALRELRKPSHSRRLRPFLPEAVESEAYRHTGAREFDRTWMSSTERAAIDLYNLLKEEDWQQACKRKVGD